MINLISKIKNSYHNLNPEYKWARVSAREIEYNPYGFSIRANINHKPVVLIHGMIKAGKDYFKEIALPERHIPDGDCTIINIDNTYSIDTLIDKKGDLFTVIKTDKDNKQRKYGSFDHWKFTEIELYDVNHTPRLLKDELCKDSIAQRGYDRFKLYTQLLNFKEFKKRLTSLKFEYETN